MGMDEQQSKPASTTRTKVLAAGMFLCIGGGLSALFAGLPALVAAAALATGGGLAIIAALYEYRRAPNTFLTSAKSPFDAAPDELIPSPLPAEGESWIGVDAARAARMKLEARIAYALPFILLLPWGWVRYEIIPTLPVGARGVARLLEIMMIAIALISAIAVIFLQQGVKRALRSRIGADRTHLLYDPGTGKVERHEWASVLTDKFQLLIGRRIVALVRPLFPVEGLRPLILARLHSTSFIGHTRFQWTALRRGNPWLWAMFAPLCAMAIAQLVSELRPEWFKAANEAFVAWLRASAS